MFNKVTPSVIKLKFLLYHHKESEREAHSHVGLLAIYCYCTNRVVIVPLIIMPYSILLTLVFLKNRTELLVSFMEKLKQNHEAHQYPRVVQAVICQRLLNGFPVLAISKSDC